MSLKELYNLLKEIREKMYKTGEKTVELTQSEFFEVYHAICYMMQIKRIMDEQ